MNKKRCNTLLPLVQLLPAVAAAAAVLFALPRTVPVLAAVPERLAVVMEQPVEAASPEAEEEALPKLPYADGVYDIDFDLMQTNGQHFKASYDGPIELDDYTSMGGGGYAR